jgi:hypothetical protein
VEGRCELETPSRSQAASQGDALRRDTWRSLVRLNANAGVSEDDARTLLVEIVPGLRCRSAVRRCGGV